MKGGEKASTGMQGPERHAGLLLTRTQAELNTTAESYDYALAA